MTSDISRIRVARPEFRVGGEDRPALSQDLLGLLVSEDTAGLYSCEALFSNWGLVDGQVGFRYFDRRVLDFGRPFLVRLGGQTLFEGRIVGLEAHFPEGRAPELSVLAEDRLQDLRMTRRTRSFSQIGDQDLVGQVAREHGLRADVSLRGPTHRVLAQVNQSDLAFLRERARAVDAELWVDGDTLRARAHTGRAGESVTLSYGETLHEFSVLADLAHQRTSVTVGGWDVAAKRAIAAEAGDAVLGAELAGGRSGASVLRAALGERREALAHTVPLAADVAQAEADTYFRLAARRFLVGQGVAAGNALLRVGATVTIDRLGPLFSGRYYLTEVRHTYDGAQGLRSGFTAERPSIGS